MPLVSTSSIVASAIANFSMCHPKKALVASDFGLGPRLSSTTASRAPRSHVEQVHMLGSAFRMAAGKAPLTIVNREILDV